MIVPIKITWLTLISDDSLSESHSFFSESDDMAVSKDLVTNADLGLTEDHFSRPEVGALISRTDFKQSVM